MTAGLCPTGCGRAVRPGHLMCGACWREVPKARQRDVYRTWGRVLDGAGPGAMDEYTQAREAAIGAVTAPGTGRHQ